jgi:hypothetical protein
MDPTIVKILQKASDNNEYQQLANYLMSRRSMPDFNLGYMPGTYGKFITPGLFSSGNIPERGIVSINESAKTWNPESMSPTMVHELTHAAEKQMIKQYYEIKKKTNKTELENQFLNNFQKIIGSSEPEVSNWLKKVSPNFYEENKGYRANSGEALAFGVENSAFQSTDSNRPAPQHIDPTMATTLMLLLDQAQRVQNQQPQSQGR